MSLLRRPKLIKSDRGGIIFDANMFAGLNGNGDLVDIVKRHPLYNDRNRQAKLAKLNENPEWNTHVQLNNKAIANAINQFEQVMQYNQNLLEKGYDPNNPNDRKHFKQLSKEALALATSAINGTVK